MIGRSMTAPPLVLSTGNIFPAIFVSLRLHLRKEKFGAVFQNVTFYHLCLFQLMHFLIQH
jgi:hypothetical protein